MNRSGKGRTEGLKSTFLHQDHVLQASCRPAVLQWLLGLQETFQGPRHVPRKSFFPLPCCEIWVCACRLLSPEPAQGPCCPSKLETLREGAESPSPDPQRCSVGRGTGSHPPLTEEGCCGQSQTRSLPSQICIGIDRSCLSMSLNIFPWSNTNVIKYILAH